VCTVTAMIGVVGIVLVLGFFGHADLVIAGCDLS
jgi:hypothetical protein